MWETINSLLTDFVYTRSECFMTKKSNFGAKEAESNGSIGETATLDTSMQLQEEDGPKTDSP